MSHIINRRLQLYDICNILKNEEGLLLLSCSSCCILNFVAINPKMPSNGGEIGAFALTDECV